MECRERRVRCTLATASRFLLTLGLAVPTPPRTGRKCAAGTLRRPAPPQSRRISRPNASLVDSGAASDAYRRRRNQIRAATSGDSIVRAVRRQTCCPLASWHTMDCRYRSWMKINAVLSGVIVQVSRSRAMSASLLARNSLGGVTENSPREWNILCHTSSSIIHRMWPAPGPIIWL